MTNGFLPDNYETPKQTSNYFKLVDGDNKFRILSSPILGWLDRDDKKPVRTKEKPETPIDPTRPVKFFWAMAIYDFSDKKIKIWECTQRSIQQAIEGLVNDEDFGSPLEYPIKITRSGKDLETKYAVKPLGKEVLAPEIASAYFDAMVNLEALYEGADPFKK